ncbi:MAG: AI-2E family transporter [Cohaesibacteraceae bacterium]|nr:AI-2E family transporter [Cohaesibacteraceae bacterium]
MSIKRHFIFWCSTLIVMIVGLYVFRSILLPFVAGMALAYMLDPVADRLQSIGCSRLWSTIIILLLFVIVFLMSLMIIIPILGSQLLSFIESLPGYVKSLQQVLTKTSESGLDLFLDKSIAEKIRASFGSIVDEGAQWLAKLLGSVLSGGEAILNILSLLVITPVVAFYLLWDWDQMVDKIDSWLPRQHQKLIRTLAKEMDAVVADFVRGQMTLGLVMGIFYAACLMIVGLKFGLLIGLGAGFIRFIPYVGAILGFVVAGGVALVQFWPDPTPILITVAIFVVGQFLEGNVLQPYLVGDKIGLHPVWLMFALLAFGTLFGFVGLLIAVPTAAAIGVLVRYGLSRYLDSPMYHGKPAE